MVDQSNLYQLAVDELQRLQLKHRCLQLDLQSLIDDKTKLLGKRNNITNVLQEEYNDLKNEINLLSRSLYTKKNFDKEKRLHNLQNQKTDLLRSLQYEQLKLWELEGHIRKIKKEIDVLRKNDIADTCYNDAISIVQKNVVKLENRLDVVNKKCSDVLTENCKLRYLLNHNLQDRGNFNVMWQSMVAQFNEGRKYIMDLIDQSTVAYDQREEICNKLQALKERNENDKILHIQEMREMQRRLEHDAKLQRFYDIKGLKRYNFDLEQRDVKKKMAQKENFEKQISGYIVVINKIQEIYDKSNTNQLSAQFKRQEEGNFALFNYVSELNHEVEILNTATLELRNEIERQRSDQIDKELKHKTEAFDTLQSQLKRKQNLADIASKKNISEDLRLQQLLTGITEIFKYLTCDDTPIVNILSPNSFLTLHNVKLFIGVIEHYIDLFVTHIQTDESSIKILAKKDRVPKFNINESVKINKFM